MAPLIKLDNSLWAILNFILEPLLLITLTKFDWIPFYSRIHWPTFLPAIRGGPRVLLPPLEKFWSSLRGAIPFNYERTLMKERRNYESTNVEKEGKEFDEYARNGNHSEIKILSLEQDFVSREKKRVIFFFNSRFFEFDTCIWFV